MFSMTGYGSSEYASPLGPLTVEVYSLNKRFFDLQVHLPKSLLPMEGEVRKLMRSLVVRGKVQVTISLDVEQTKAQQVVPKLSLLQAYAKAWQAACTELNLSTPFPMAGLLQSQDFFCSELTLDEGDLAQMMPCLLEAVKQAVDNLLVMKEDEGKKICTELLGYLNEMQPLVEALPSLVSVAQENWKDKLLNVLKGYFDQVSSEDRERVMRELVLISDKMDLSEEVKRLSYHLQAAMQLITSEEGAKGKRLEFLLQEMGREVNTIGAKASHCEISRHVVDLKCLIEKVREQVQNVE